MRALPPLPGLLAATMALLAVSLAQSPTCFFLRFNDRNMDQVEAAALRAAGLGRGAGQYLTPDQVADLAGRTKQELQQLEDTITSLGGDLGMVGQLRDAARACFNEAGTRALASAFPADKALDAHRRLVQGHQPSNPPSENMLSLTTSLAAALSERIPEGMIQFIIPPSATGTEEGKKPAGRSPQPTARFRHRGTGSSPVGSSITFPNLDSDRAPVIDAFIDGNLYLPIPGPYRNTTLQYGDEVFGSWGGYVYQVNNSDSTSTNSSSSLAAPIVMYQTWSPLVFLGTANASYLLKNINVALGVLTFMLPCRVGSATHFATADEAFSCAAPRLSTNFSTNYNAFGNIEWYPYMRNIKQEAISITSCAEAIKTSKGQLPSDLCARLSSQIANVSATPNDIGNDTALYTVNVAKAANMPTYVAIQDWQLSIEWHIEVGNATAITSLTWPMQGISNSTLSIAGANTPAQLRKLYNVPSKNLGTAKGLLSAVSLYSGTVYDMSPNSLKIANSVLGGSLEVLNIGASAKPLYADNQPDTLYGPQNSPSSDSTSEAELDIQMLTQYGDGSGSSFAFVASDSKKLDYHTPMEDLFMATLGLDPLPDVFSWSYGGSTVDQNANAVLAKFAAMGITVIVSSGDSGVYSNSDGTCYGVIAPSYPAASQWVTAVGAIMVAKPTPKSEPTLVACMSPAGGLITSGGGFGNVSLGTTPKWQKTVVDKYIRSQSHLSSWPLRYSLNPNAVYSGNCTRADSNGPAQCVYGRGYPDLAVIGSIVPIVSNSAPEPVAGTSVSAPVVNGLVAHINAAIRATPGLHDKKIGYMNPFLYWAAEEYPASFIDITIGRNGFHEDPNNKWCPLGYNAVPGWDAVTGLGMPDIAVLQKAAVAYVKKQVKQQR